MITRRFRRLYRSGETQWHRQGRLQRGAAQRSQHSGVLGQTVSPSLAALRLHQESVNAVATYCYGRYNRYPRASRASTWIEA